MIDTVSTASDESAFESVLDDWRRVAGKPSPFVAADEEARFARILSDERELRRQGRWRHGATNVFRVLRLHRDEVRHSAMIAWLLDPCGHHGLGITFLASVTRRACGTTDLAPPLLDVLSDARTDYEEARGSSRIDIIVRAGTQLTLVIENKVDADESDLQCQTYFDLYGHEPGARFLFLTPDRDRRPASVKTDAARDAFRWLSYHDLRDDLAAALAEGDHTARSRVIAEGYLDTLLQEFR